MNNLNNKFLNADYLLKRAKEAHNEKDNEYASGLINDLIDELNGIKKDI